MRYFVLFLVCLFFCSNAIAICEKQEVEVDFSYKVGPVFYNNKLGQNEFKSLFGKDKVSYRVGGLTVGKLNVSYEPIGSIIKTKDGFCVNLDKINFKIGYDKFDVYIDKKYKKDSCQYNAVKTHEDEHVLIFKEAMTFFAPDLKKSIRESVANILPEKVYDSVRAEQIFHKKAKEVLSDIRPLLNHINQKIEEKQALIDTVDSYEKVQRKCKRW